MQLKSSIPAPRATFSYRSYGDVIAVIDHDEGRSVTNDAEAVIEQLAQKFDLSKYRVIYRDTRGVWDELRVRDARFDGFGSINETGLDAALAKVKAASAGGGA
jgi:hypothetical protein